MQIRAYAIKEKGGKAKPFEYERAIGSHDVLVRITHCSLARGDIQYMDDDWGDARFPLVPGHEIVGIVEELGSEVADLQRGDRVGIGYQQEACFDCSFCKQGTEQFCPRQKVIAVDRYGGLAEHIVVDGRFAFRLPQQLDSARSAPLLSSGLTVYAGILRARLPRRLSRCSAGRRRARSPGHTVPSRDGPQRYGILSFAQQAEVDRAVGGSIRGQLGHEVHDEPPRSVRSHPFDVECRVRP